MSTRRMTQTMTEALDHFKEHGDFGDYHKRTINALENRGIVQSKTGGGYEMVGESQAAPRINQLESRWITNDIGVHTTHDVGQPDYFFWDRLRKSLIEGLELGGLFIKPLASKVAAWSFGMVPRFRLSNDKAQEELNKWWSKRHTDVLRALEDAIQMGDAYLVINANLTVTVVPATVVEPIVDENDYSRIIGRKITEIYEHPTKVNQRMKIVDEYYADRRIRRTSINNGPERVQRFRNMTGFIPVIHIPFNKGADESFGHPIGEALVRMALRIYDRLFEAAAKGNEIQGRPTPVISQVGDVDQINAFWEKFGKKTTVTNQDGTTSEKITLDFRADRLLTLGGTARFDWMSPGSFTKDTEVLLGLIFYLVLQHTEIPEFIWGNALSGNRASAETQMEPFIKFIQKLQGTYVSWMIEISAVVLGYIGLWETDAQMDQSIDEDIRVIWQSLSDKDGKLTLDAITLAINRAEPLMDDETALELMDMLDIEDPAAVIEKAREQREDRENERNRRDEEMLDSIDDNDEPTDDEDQPDENNEDDEEDTSEAFAAAIQEALNRPVPIMEAHTGALIALELDGEGVAMMRQASRGAGISDEDMVDWHHITLCYLGDSTQLDYNVQKVIRVVESWVSYAADWIMVDNQLSGVVQGVGRFENDQGDGTHPIYASVDSKEIVRARNSLAGELMYSDIEVMNNHVYLPHITLAYIDADAPTPDVRFRTRPELSFSYFVIKWGDETHRIDMKRKEIVQ